MTEFSVSDATRERELSALAERGIPRRRAFVLLLGPSAVGKSKVIEEMNALGRQRFSYVRPVTTRPNRPGETDKTSVPDQKFDDMQARGDFVVVNELYGVRYGTPVEGILNPQSLGEIPVLDYPLDTVDRLKDGRWDLVGVYLYPSSFGEWRERMESVGRDVAGRYEAGMRELGMLAAHHMRSPWIDLSIVNRDGGSRQAATEIVDTLDTVLRD